MDQSNMVGSSEKVRDAMFALKYETMLQSVHPIVTTNVTNAVAELLAVLDRADLVEEWVRL